MTLADYERLDARTCADLRLLREAEVERMKPAEQGEFTPGVFDEVRPGVRRKVTRSVGSTLG